MPRGALGFDFISVEIGIGEKTAAGTGLWLNFKPRFLREDSLEPGSLPAVSFPGSKPAKEGLVLSAPRRDGRGASGGLTSGV